jgi:hypothetical protein
MLKIFVFADFQVLRVFFITLCACLLQFCGLYFGGDNQRSEEAFCLRILDTIGIYHKVWNGFSEMLVLIYQTTRRYVLEDTVVMRCSCLQVTDWSLSWCKRKTYPCIRHEGIRGSRGIPPLILNLDTRRRWSIWRVCSFQTPMKDLAVLFEQEGE